MNFVDPNDENIMNKIRKF